MSDRWRPRHTLTAIAILAAAVTLMPVAVHAAGSLVTVTDSVVSGRNARVSTSSGLVTDSRPNAPIIAYDSLNVSFVPTGAGFAIASSTSPSRVAISSWLLAAGGTTAGSIRVRLYARYRSSGTAACSATANGYVIGHSKTAIVPVGQTLNIEFGTPFVVPVLPAGVPYCYIVDPDSGPSGSSLTTSLHGYVSPAI